MGITDGYINNRWFIVLEMPPAALHAAREFSYTPCRKFFHLIYTGMANNLLIVKIPKAFCKPRLYCAEIEVYHLMWGIIYIIYIL
jgi:hypothetical protein